MLHSPEARVTAPDPLTQAQAGDSRAESARASLGAFDASRYFRDDRDAALPECGARRSLRALDRQSRASIATTGRSVTRWRLPMLSSATALEVKGVGIETLACFRRQFTPALLPTWKRWLASNRSANWATTDSICGSLIGPLLLAHPELVGGEVVDDAIATCGCAGRPRRAVRLAARGVALNDAYASPSRLPRTTHDLIHKAAGWLLREAGKTDPARLERTC